MRHVFRLPDVGEGIAQAEIVEYLVNVGDQVKADQIVLKIETDKAVVELPAPYAGIIAEIPHKPGDTVNVGDPLLIIETEGRAEAEKPAAEDKKPEPQAQQPIRKVEEATREPVEEAPEGAAAKILATPHTRRLARELKVDISAVKGSGDHGRITDDDVRRAAAKAEPAPPKAPTAAAARGAATAGFDFEKYGPTRREPLKGIRKRVAEVMVRSVSTIPHVTHFAEADVTKLVEVVEHERGLAEKRGIKLTLLSFLAKATAGALKEYPVLNSSLDEETGEIVYKDYIHIGIATDTGSGLMVPVMRDVDRKSILQIASELHALAEKARDRTIDLEDLRGGSFSISNVGAIGGSWATPIIQHPNVAILLSLRAAPKPVVRENQVVIRTMMPLALSFDHRVLDGADAARFMNHLVGLLEDPMLMLVDVA